MDATAAEQPVNPSGANWHGSEGRPGEPAMPAGRVRVGRFVLEIGASAGTAVLEAGDEEEAGDARQLERALKEDDGGPPKPRDGRLADAAGALVDDASNLTSKFEHAVGLFTQLAERRLDPKALSSEIPFLLDLVERLDREQRWSEALALARAVSGLLALLMRWVDLVRSLRTVLEMTEKLGDLRAMGWAVHELGTLQLGAEKASAAERRLSQARELRSRVGDRDGLAVTEQNLQALCRLTNRLLRERRLLERDTRIPWLPRSRALALAVAVALLAVGTVAGAAINGSAEEGDAEGDGAANQQEPGGVEQSGGEVPDGGEGPAAGDTPVDADGDGVSSTDDCDDGNDSIFPGARDTPGDGIDQDCDGVDATID